MMEATESDLATLRAEVLPVDSVVIADDLMSCRSIAYEVLAGARRSGGAAPRAPPARIPGGRWVARLRLRPSEEGAARR